MSQRRIPDDLPIAPPRHALPTWLRLSLATAIALGSTNARAEEVDETPPLVAETQAETPTETPAATPTTTTTTTTSTATTATTTPEAPKTYGASASIETSVGLGTFVSGAQSNAAVSTTFSGSGWYTLAENLKLTAGLSLTWYQVLDIDTSLADHTVLLSDISIGISHGRIVHDEGSGFNLAGSIRVGLPTSLASQFQNRLFSLATGLSASLPVGPVTFSYGFTFGKYFNLTAVPTLDCEDFEDSSECIEGRDANPSFGFESERRGPEVYLRGSGANSFYFTNALSVSWSIVEGLELSLGLSISNMFGVRSFDQDEFANANAKSGRSQRDRLSSSLALSYQFMKQLSAALSLSTDTSEPFGSRGDDFPVIFDFSRAPDNITSLNLSVTGSF